jgi:hypothetical protein
VSRIRGYEFVLGLLMATVFWAVFFVIQPKNYSGNQETQTAPEQQSHQVLETDKADERLAQYTFWLTIFTGILAVSTIGLWCVTWRSGIKQSRDMEASIAVATRAAENAERALTRLEIPHVYPIQLKFDVRSTTNVTPTGMQTMATGVTISGRFKNYGRSPAILREAWFKMAVMRPERPMEPIFMTGRLPFMADGMIGEGESSDLFSCDPRGLIPHAQNIKAGSLRLNLQVHVDWNDVMGGRSGRMDWFVWNPAKSRFAAGTQLWTEN